MTKYLSLRQMCILLSTLIIMPASLAFASYQFKITTSLRSVFNLWYVIPQLTVTVFGNTGIFWVAFTILMVLIPAIVVNGIIHVIIIRVNTLDCSEC